MRGIALVLWYVRALKCAPWHVEQKQPLQQRPLQQQYQNHQERHQEQEREQEQEEQQQIASRSTSTFLGRSEEMVAVGGSAVRGSAGSWRAVGECAGGGGAVGVSAVGGSAVGERSKGAQ